MNESPLPAIPGFLGHYTYRGNLRDTRYGWLRLTPAYSVHLVSEMLHDSGTTRVLDPFCGTGTTALVCGERGLACDTTDINPFLIWLAQAKTRVYRPDEVDDARRCATLVRREILQAERKPTWLPPIHEISKWWDEPTLYALGRTVSAIKKAGNGTSAPARRWLLCLRYCRATRANSASTCRPRTMTLLSRLRRTPIA